MIYLVFIPLGLLFIPWVLVRYVFATEATKKLPYVQHVGYLWVASALWVASQLLPNVPISPETNSFTMHFTGGVVASVLFLYAIKAYGFKFHYTWELWISLFLFASALGVLNELFEFAADKVGFIPLPDYIGVKDTWWDLVANTTGAFAAFAVVRIAKKLSRRA